MNVGVSIDVRMIHAEADHGWIGERSLQAFAVCRAPLVNSNQSVAVTTISVMRKDISIPLHRWRANCRLNRIGQADLPLGCGGPLVTYRLFAK
ncbi:hypothetical protein CA13_29420 [Planctomycetes bacterium CA13]|uniref:Uncharacterized protein n=1 Tax=Novipirellula herctigrandis TaxID=2527986 RepID=A0A5C5Z2A9_9BACT|nr:hypothetical protein CA13_29420 [Planctomycetes bacterium CA13]